MHTSRIKKIIITGDILRTSGTRPGNQNTNINWFFNLVAPLIQRAVRDVTIERLLSTADPQTFNVEHFYRLNGMEVSIANWAELFDSPSVAPQAEAYFADYFRDCLVIGYELPVVFTRLLTRAGSACLNAILHPVRFLDDVFFGLTSNMPAINAKLQAYRLNEEAFYAAAAFHKATISRLRPLAMQPDSALLVGQTEVDRSLIQNGRIVSLLDYQDEIAALRRQHQALYFKPHPYAGQNDAVQRFVKAINAQITGENVYYLLCQDSTRAAYGVSSSVILEAGYFGVNARCFKPNAFGENIPVLNHYLGSRFWADILESVCCVDATQEFAVPALPNRMRDSLGLYWGYPVFGLENRYKELSREERKRLDDICRLLKDVKLIPLNQMIKSIKGLWNRKQS